ncbi:helix-hairpin-helix domain-containing protein [Ideonella oryzae]|uniref:Helix-hairpin-helix domain-containing protein n=1 Tax=Ideonella oryzae TaxID=2937441 RepID=A0ABT1BKE5_9BURK|nr:helix-hairpin-helix domain-containing protein [Ideonella oryzae]MCO5976682.1 helix-hairpin-helix domain-containing protein [Ideonella oryzae]
MIKRPKATRAEDCQTLEQLPNVGPAMAGDLRALGLHHPQDLRGQDPLALYRRLEALTGSRQDPCVLDTFMAIVDFMEGGPPRPWWSFTALRKQRHGVLQLDSPGPTTVWDARDVGHARPPHGEGVDLRSA